MTITKKLLHTSVFLFSLISIVACGVHNDIEPVSEGSPVYPITVTVGVPFPGQVGEWGTSYYAFSTGDAGSYTISLTDVESDLSWTLWSTPDFFTIKVSDCDDWVNVIANESCSIDLTANTIYYLQVDEWLYYPSYFTLTVF